jgi:hypothetical protein
MSQSNSELKFAVMPNGKFSWTNFAAHEKLDVLADAAIGLEVLTCSETITERTNETMTIMIALFSMRLSDPRCSRL